MTHSSQKHRSIGCLTCRFPMGIPVSTHGLPALMLCLESDCDSCLLIAMLFSIQLQQPHPLLFFTSICFFIGFITRTSRHLWTLLHNQQWCYCNQDSFQLTDPISPAHEQKINKMQPQIYHKVWFKIFCGIQFKYFQVLSSSLQTLDNNYNINKIEWKIHSLFQAPTGKRVCNVIYWYPVVLIEPDSDMSCDFKL